MKTVYMLVPYRGLMQKSIIIPDDVSAKDAIAIYNKGVSFDHGYETDDLDAEVMWSGKARLQHVEKH